MTKLDSKQIKELVNAYAEMKKAEGVFQKLRAEYCGADLEAGWYECEYGRVMKTVMQKTLTDWKKLAWDHPEIDISKYTSTKEVTAINIQNYNVKSGLFS